MIHYRLSNDEKHIRRLVKKFHTYLTASRKSTSSGSEDVEVSDARRSFLLELATFQLFVQKCETVCGKEERQVEEYELERETIGAHPTSDFLRWIADDESHKSESA
jgi:THO complex subunit 7